MYSSDNNNNMQLNNSNNGEWYITVVDASCVKGFDKFSKSDLYVQVKYGGQMFKTKTAKNQESPVWNETFAFPFNNMNNTLNENQSLEIVVSDDDLFKDDAITVAAINSSQFPAFGEEKEYSIPLAYKNKDIGILHIRIRNGGKNNNFGNNYNNLQSTSAIGNNDNGGYNATILGGHSYGNNNLNTNPINNLNDETRRGSGGGDYTTNLNDINNADSRIVSHTITENRYVDSSGLSSNVSNNFDQQHSNQHFVSTYGNIGHTNNLSPLNNNINTTNNLSSSSSPENITTIENNNTTTLLPPPTNATAATLARPLENISNNTTTTTGTSPIIANLTPSTEITKKRRHKGDTRKVHLPEKHHHYEDGYTSSSSESSNEGEKKRAAQGKLGQSDLQANADTTTTYRS